MNKKPLIRTRTGERIGTNRQANAMLLKLDCGHDKWWPGITPPERVRCKNCSGLYRKVTDYHFI